MFVPLRWLREPPRHLLVCERSHVRHERSSHVARVRDHAFNCRVTFLIPNCGLVPDIFKSAVASLGEYYLVKNLPLHEIVTEEFISTFVKKGSCYALTYNTRIDEDNTAALLPTVINIDLTEPTFGPDSKRYKRVIWALKEKKPLEFDFLLAWHHTGSEESTLMSYFSKNQIQALQPKVTFSTLRNLQCPVLENNKLKGEPEAACSAQEFFEWFGAILSCDDLENTASSFLSTYSCPQPSTFVDQALLCTITGFILPEKIIHILEQICCYFEEPKLAEWISLVVHGFADSPVSWKENEHGFLRGGENLYNLVIFRSLDYWLQMAVGAHDDCP
ncbi:ribonuclease P protein subunit p40 isoform X2 [Sphaerodactylus townsendi]|uniref:ribonuclease P protein subunit p40 isoform X2 n=1 Tax=Sphaerodactylus townsendi TaxID=933632 RepID=UPI0020268B59|nr:ribonuclease P protein subunit p40 isoform X2 [Sphaerodactylus townsendi]